MVKDFRFVNDSGFWVRWRSLSKLVDENISKTKMMQHDPENDGLQQVLPLLLRHDDVVVVVVVVAVVQVGHQLFPRETLLTLSPLKPLNMSSYVVTSYSMKCCLDLHLVKWHMFAPKPQYIIRNDSMWSSLVTTWILKVKSKKWNMCVLCLSHTHGATIGFPNGCGGFPWLKEESKTFDTKSQTLHHLEW